MKNKAYYIGLAVVILIFGFLTVRMVSKKIGFNSVVDDDRHRVGAEEYVDMVKWGKVPHFEFTDQNGKTISTDDYKGKVYVVEFFFVSCPSICPIQNKNMVKIQNEFLTKKDFGIASITIDPEHDTPEVLKNYAEHYGAIHENWHFLQGTQKQVFDLANEFHIGVGFGDAANGGFEHAGLFALIDKEGNIVCRKDKYGNPIGYYDGLEDESIKNLITDIGIQLRK